MRPTNRIGRSRRLALNPNKPKGPGASRPPTPTPGPQVVDQFQGARPPRVRAGHVGRARAAAGHGPADVARGPRVADGGERTSPASQVAGGHGAGGPASFAVCSEPPPRADRHLVEIGPTPYLGPGQQGLFARGPIKRNTIIGWYTGKIIDDVGGLDGYGDTMQASNSYVMRVEHPVSQKILYLIDGGQPQTAGGELCDTRLINHSRDCNCYLQVVPHPFSHAGFAMAVKAQKNIHRGEELLLYYSDDFHDWLVDSRGAAAILDIERLQKKQRARMRTPAQKNKEHPGGDEVHVQGSKRSATKFARRSAERDSSPDDSQISDITRQSPGAEATLSWRAAPDAPTAAPRVPSIPRLPDALRQKAQMLALRLGRVSLDGSHAEIDALLRVAQGQSEASLALSVGHALEGLMRRDLVEPRATPDRLMLLVEGLIDGYAAAVIANVVHRDTLEYALRHGSERVLSRLLELSAHALTVNDLVDLIVANVSHTRPATMAALFGALEGDLRACLGDPRVAEAFYREAPQASALAYAQRVGEGELQRAIALSSLADEAQDVMAWFRPRASAAPTGPDMLSLSIEVVHAAGLGRRAVEACVESAGDAWAGREGSILQNELAPMVVRAAEYGRADVLAYLASHPAIGLRACQESMSPDDMEDAMLGAIQSGLPGVIRQLAALGANPQTSEVVRISLDSFREAGLLF